MRCLNRIFIVLILLLIPNARAVTVRTRDGQVLEGELRFEPADWVQVISKSVGEFPLAYKLANIASIQFRAPVSGIRSGGSLPGDWNVQDIGAADTGGTSAYSQGEFTLNGEGGPGGSSVDSLHYLYRRLPTNGQLIARVRNFTASDADPAPLDPPAMAGIMIRQGLEPGERFCAIALSAADGPRFLHRRAVDAPVSVTPVVSRVKIKAPYWLRLMRYGDRLVAHISFDGKTWEPIANPEIQNLRDAYIGLFVDSNRAGQLAGAVFDHVRVTIHGLEGKYFADPKFKDLRLTRLDPQLNFSWYGVPPADDFPGQNFSVRWTGQLFAPSSDTYRFALAADTAARLYINDKVILDTASKTAHDGSVKLIGEQRYEIRIDYVANTSAATACRLYWSTTAQPEPQIVPSEYLYHAPPPRAEAPPDPNAAPPKPWAVAKGLLLTDGSFLQGSPAGADDKSVSFVRPGRKAMAIPLDHVAWLVMHPLADTSMARIPAKGAGLLTVGGDFIDGDCQEINAGKAKLNSIVFGVSSFDLATQTAAVVYHGPGPSDAPWLIRTAGGGEIRATSFRVDRQTLTLEEPIIGPIELRLAEIVDITRR